ncbi:fumarylacetoacetate hydrolase family protein [Pleionea sediminis]|uniref:fumarylacetoacetate hydrolase family protein n=1 Tax=Pleionea sediminis TaxID=2569479 RepID=UPI00118591A2|nr:fumarylacetoacetate hydrolase family protein [Pleionea sediminis]
MHRVLISALFILTTVLIGLIYLNRDLPNQAMPATLHCLNEQDGEFLGESIRFGQIYGIGLSYANHINETASRFQLDASPPVFKKSSASLISSQSSVIIPDEVTLLHALQPLEPGIERLLNDEDIVLQSLVDHEVELALIVLEDFTAQAMQSETFIPKLGFTVGNDLSARSIAALGEGKENRFDYWGVSKSFDGFLPLSKPIWRPVNESHNSIPCVELKTWVNGELRQSDNTKNLIYTPRQMIQFILDRYQLTSMKRGDVILTGTPGGVILTVPRWKARLAQMLSLNRFTKLSAVQDTANQFLQEGDSVTVSAEWLGEITVTLNK